MIDESVLIKEIKQEADTRFAGLDSCVGFEEMILWIESQPKIGDWIPCSEPPKHNREVLIFNGKSYSVGYYDGKTWVNAIHPVEWQEIHHG